jgi:hypothetical protein
VGALFGDPLPAAPFSLPTPLCDGCPPFATNPAVSPLPPRPLFAIPQTNCWLRDVVCGGGGPFRPSRRRGRERLLRGTLGTNLCPAGSEQVLSRSAQYIYIYIYTYIYIYI